MAVLSAHKALSSRYRVYRARSGIHRAILTTYIGMHVIDKVREMKRLSS